MDLLGRVDRGAVRNSLSDFGYGMLKGKNFSDGLEQMANRSDTQAPIRQRQVELQMQQQQEAQEAKLAAERAKGNAQYLVGDPALQAMVANQSIPFEAAYNIWKSKQPGAPVDPTTTVGGRTQLAQQFGLDPQAAQSFVLTGKLPEGMDIKDQFAIEQGLSQQYGQAAPLKTYEEVKAGYERVRTAAQADSGAGDVGVVYGFMKMLDPGSVVREGEFATAESTAGIPQQIVGLYNKLLSGERLTPQQRQQFAAMAEELYSDASSNLTGLNTQYEGRASRWGADPANIVRQPETFDPLNLGATAGDVDAILKSYGVP
jgi:hypothetical protein